MNIEIKNNISSTIFSKTIDTISFKQTNLANNIISIKPLDTENVPLLPSKHVSWGGIKIKYLNELEIELPAIPESDDDIEPPATPEPNYDTEPPIIPDPDYDTKPPTIPEPDYDIEPPAIPEPDYDIELPAIPEPDYDIELPAIPDPDTKPPTIPEPDYDIEPLPTSKSNYEREVSIKEGIIEVAISIGNYIASKIKPYI